MKLNRWLCILAGLLAVCLTAGAAAQQPPVQTPQAAKPTIKKTAVKPMDGVEGKETYDAYCAVCHGKGGRGDGPAAPALKGPIPDLTTIAKRNGGKFQGAAVQEGIKGVNKTAHGSPDMPIWGPVFNSMSYSAGVTELRMANLVKYIESMQQK